MIVKQISRGNISRAGTVLLVTLAVLLIAVAVSVREAKANAGCPPGYEWVFAVFCSGNCAAHWCCMPIATADADDDGSPDGGKGGRRWNEVSNMWERDFSRWLYGEGGVYDPFDLVFGHFDHFHWSYGQAIQYLLNQGYSQAQLSTTQGQIDALVQEGLWDPATQTIPEGADLSFLADPPPEPGHYPWLPTW